MHTNTYESGNFYDYRRFSFQHIKQICLLQHQTCHDQYPIWNHPRTYNKAMFSSRQLVGSTGQGTGRRDKPTLNSTTLDPTRTRTYTKASVIIQCVFLWTSYSCTAMPSSPLSDNVNNRNKHKNKLCCKLFLGRDRGFFVKAHIEKWEHASKVRLMDSRVP